MTPEEKLDIDAVQLVNLWIRIFTILKEQTNDMADDSLIDVATKLATAEIRRNGAHSK